MELLSDLNLLTGYHKGVNDIAAEFYLPCMSRAISYDRAVGFFNSTIYVIAWPSLKDFVERKGRMRIICSPILSQEDINALGEGYSARCEERNAELFQEEIRRMLSDPSIHKPTRVLATLVSLGVIELHVAFMTGTSLTRRLFHDKLGIFRDSKDNIVVFKGSMNETWTGLASDGNLESVDVYVSWADQREASRVKSEEKYFESLWQDQHPGVKIRPFPEIAKHELISAADPKNLFDDMEEICRQMEVAIKLSPERKKGGRVLRPHQALAIEEWVKNNRRGILEHATGSGKTFTALSAVRMCLEDNYTSLILVPSELLLKQWHAEIIDTLSDLRPDILLCGAGYSRWREEGLLGPWTKAAAKPRIVIATIQTASSEEFIRNIRKGEHLMIVADEVHRIGSPEHRKIMTLESGARLGLSATPKRAGDALGTRLIFEYFGGIIPPPFTLKDAISTGVLTPYAYHVHTVLLSDDEQNAWDNLTKKIRQLMGRQSGTSSESSFMDDDRIKLLLIQRSRILKSAREKIALALQIITNNYHVGERWIIYCDSQDQLYRVLDALRTADIKADEYHSEMPGDRRQTLSLFESNGGILVSIKCLDEGVDIPSVSHALILASSKNPREFIQRRGRVLRRAPDKYLAHIHDAIVIPPWIDDAERELAIVEGELSRAIEFGLNATNPSSITELQRIALKYGIDFTALIEKGYEDDGEN